VSLSHFVTHVDGYYANGSSVQNISTLKTMEWINEFQYVLRALENYHIPDKSVFIIYLCLPRPTVGSRGSSVSIVSD
jgi:hypothetical protein